MSRCPPGTPLMSQRMNPVGALSQDTLKNCGFSNTLPDALLFVLSASFRKIFILQLVGLVLTNNFSDCDFEKIRMDYLNIISKDLTCTDCDATLRCEDQGGAGPLSCHAFCYPHEPPPSSPSVGSLALSSPGSHWLRPRSPFHSFLTNSISLFFSTPTPHPVACSPFLVNVAAGEQPDCLTKIERLTLHPTPGCKSLPEELASRTQATLERSCPGYYRKQKNNAQAMKKRKKREDTIKGCQKIVSNLIGLWRRFMRL
ncbi:PREDICTED: thymic stromal lymphopoietin [Myotis davidii]|uniref:thymic stromal lymphopoietin n=1 Tax=Myotis davidii TaxID=225400 RepID=UPI0003EC366F|nr:PREDICTED: thymic stromal lymphopoietin [Myotis davidii]